MSHDEEDDDTNHAVCNKCGRCHFCTVPLVRDITSKHGSIQIEPHFCGHGKRCMHMDVESLKGPPELLCTHCERMRDTVFKDDFTRVAACLWCEINKGDVAEQPGHTPGTRS